MATIDFFTTIPEFREFVTGWDASQPLAELAPSFRAVRRDIVNLIGQDTYDTLKAFHDAETPDETDTITPQAVEYLQAALSNLIMSQHFIFLAVAKNKTAADIYKYQYDEIRDKYTAGAWAAMNDLLGYLDENVVTFTDYADLPAYKERQTLIIKSYTEFEKYFGIDNSSWFFTRLVFLIKEVQEDAIIPRIKTWDDVKDDESLATKIKRALAYQTIYLALDRFDFASLPQSIRSRAGNEGNRIIQSRYSDDAAKLLLAGKLKTKAAEYFAEIDLLIKQRSTTGLTEPENLNVEEDGFYQMM